MSLIKLDLTNTTPFIQKEELIKYQKLVIEKNELLETKSGKGSDFLGWLHYPNTISDGEINEINQTAQTLREKSDYIVVIGIGGSYLGSKAIIEALSGHFKHEAKKEKPEILFAGHNLSEDYHYELIDFLKDKDFSLIVISKSGTTTEPAIAFRLLRNEIEKKYGIKEASSRIIAITDKSKGALRELANQNNYTSFIINDDIGGRYSVFSPVGILPIACAGINIKDLLSGAKDMLKHSTTETFEENPVFQYATVRNILCLKDKKIEILANYDSRLNLISEWWKQLFGESEGKEHKGIFPASVSFTTDLHSMGQYVQEGLRTIFETVLFIEKNKHSLTIPADKDNYDKLNFLEKKALGYVNKMAALGTSMAHVEGGVPVIKISIPELNEYYLGQLLYFFEKSCAISGYLLDINPFDQPGVEAYKRNMFALLEKPGFEKETQDIKRKLSN